MFLWADPRDTASTEEIYSATCIRIHTYMAVAQLCGNFLVHWSDPICLVLP